VTDAVGKLKAHGEGYAALDLRATTLQFAHAETIVPLLVLLGPYKVRLLLRRAPPCHVVAFVCAGPFGGGQELGLGGIVALHYRSSSWYQIHEEIRYLYVWNDHATEPYQEDPPLTVAAALTDPSAVEARQWRSSRISPMATNLMLILHQCADGEALVSLEHNEQPVRQPLCGGKLFCPCPGPPGAFRILRRP
jgi:hypothetical protein